MPYILATWQMLPLWARLVFWLEIAAISAFYLMQG